VSSKLATTMARRYLPWWSLPWRATEEMSSTKDWQTARENGNFTVSIDLAANYFDDPTIQLAGYGVA
jgi:hypothetical protein